MRTGRNGRIREIMDGALDERVLGGLVVTVLIWE
jgi:hypothetical protein